VKFFLPFWFADHVCEPFDPWNDEWKRGQTNWKFIWELKWERLPFDGLLISRPNVERARRWKQLFEEKGIYDAIRLPQHIPTFGDCGAWSYIRDKQPPYNPEETLDFYRRMKFTCACTVDHIVLPETMKEKYQRLQTTLRNAEIMKKRWDSDHAYYGFELVGVVQGWDEESYFQSAKQIIDMNFGYIALGGQARSPSKVTQRILKRCHPLWKGRDIQVHMFGIARWNLFDAYRKFGVTSFDNAYHRRAWISATNNYEIDDKAYTAIRIPLSDRNASKRRKVEQQVFGKLELFDRRKVGIASFLNVLHRYDPSRVEKFHKEYERTLKDRPWEECDCPMCRSLGINVCVFRTSERNMRRGFHNLWNFYKRLKCVYGTEGSRKEAQLQGLTKWF